MSIFRYCNSCASVVPTLPQHNQPHAKQEPDFGQALHETTVSKHLGHLLLREEFARRNK